MQNKSGRLQNHLLSCTMYYHYYSYRKKRKHLRETI